MNASQAFRSHLMQQFAASARSQSRPPLAMMGWRPDQDAPRKKKTTSDTPSRTSTTPTATVRNVTTAAENAATPNPSRVQAPPKSKACSSPTHMYDQQRYFQQQQQSRQRQVRRLSTVNSKSSASQSSCISSIAEEDVEMQRNESDQLAHQFQWLLKSRRTTSHFAPLSSAPTILKPTAPPSSQIQAEQEETNESLGTPPSIWRDALDRAVACARQAPNHKRTEPFFFHRILAPSPAATALADIAYQVAKQRDKRATGNTDDPYMEARAQLKRDKWSNIPAFLVAVVQAPQPIVHPSDITAAAAAAAAAAASNTGAGTGMYDPIPCTPPQSERELEDYAAACAAVQNVLLSLHSEHMASKWATGSVIQTRAFRELIHACPQDRVVALIMVGWPKTTAIGSNNDANVEKKIRIRRFRREWDDLLRDL